MNLIDHHRAQIERLNRKLGDAGSNESKLELRVEILAHEKEIVRLESSNHGFWIGIFIGGCLGVFFGTFLASVFSSWRY